MIALLPPALELTQLARTIRTGCAHAASDEAPHARTTCAQVRMCAHGFVHVRLRTPPWILRT
eukprot:247589-Rhodomonas_salina.2